MIEIINKDLMDEKKYLFNKNILFDKFLKIGFPMTDSLSQKMLASQVNDIYNELSDKNKDRIINEVVERFSSLPQPEEIKSYFSSMGMNQEFIDKFVPIYDTKVNNLRFEISQKNIIEPIKDFLSMKEEEKEKLGRQVLINRGKSINEKYNNLNPKIQETTLNALKNLNLNKNIIEQLKYNHISKKITTPLIKDRLNKINKELLINKTENLLKEKLIIKDYLKTQSKFEKEIDLQ